MTARRIRWEPGEDGILFGYSGTLKHWAFAICPPRSPGDFWMISTPFPLGQPRYVGSEEEARKAAERWLTEFVSSLGEPFEPGTTPDTAILAASEDTRCSAVVIVDEDDAYPCGAPSSYVVARSDGDTSFGINGGSDECCDEHLAETVDGMIGGDEAVYAVVRIRWQERTEEEEPR